MRQRKEIRSAGLVLVKKQIQIDSSRAILLFGRANAYSTSTNEPSTDRAGPMYLYFATMLRK